MNIWIVAIDHELQLTSRPNDSEIRTALKSELEELLRCEISERQVRFIAEESKPEEATIAMVAANEASPQIPWINIMMTRAERADAGIEQALDNRPGGPDWPTMEYWVDRRIPEDEIREDFFIEQTLCGAGDAQSVLMLLGDLHVEAVAEKLIHLGHSVTTNHDLCPVKRWE